MLPKCYDAQNSSHTYRIKNDAIQSVNNAKVEKPWYILIKSLLSEFITVVFSSHAYYMQDFRVQATLFASELKVPTN